MLTIRPALGHDPPALTIRPVPCDPACAQDGDDAWDPADAQDSDWSFDSRFWNMRTTSGRFVCSFS
ncbi:hypothetical protein GCM10023074_51030 [Microbispora amethystogenes]